MTKNNKWRRSIRQRMERTGERYTAARAQILAASAGQEHAAEYPGLLPGYGRLGGVQSDTALLARVFAHAGIVHPATGEPYSEAMVHGLCGGVGFLYGMFEYKGHAPMLTIVLRSRSMPQTYIDGAFERVGAERTTSTTTSDRVAAKALDQALLEQRPAVCVVDLPLLPHSPQGEPGMSPHYVGVIGADEERVWLDDRSLVPLPIARADLDAARKSYRAAKQALFTVRPSAGEVDWRAALEAAIADTARTLLDGDPTVPKSFRGNCGLTGMAKWQRLLTDAKDKKSWPRVFTSGGNALAGLTRAYDGIQHEYTAPRGGRPHYADFLDEAAELAGHAQLGQAAQLFRTAGERWKELADCIAAAPDEAVGRACGLADRRAEALDSGQVDALEKSLSTAPVACELEAAAAAQLYVQMAGILGAVIEIETRAANVLADAL